MTDWSRSAQEQWAEDLVAVAETAGLDRPVVVSWEQNGVARYAAHVRPDLFSSMVLVNPLQFTRELLERLIQTGGQVVPTHSIEEAYFPSRINDAEFVAWLSRAGRMGASPTVASRIWTHVLEYPESLTPSGIDLPALVLHNRDSIQLESEVRTVADHLPRATFVQVAGADTFPIAGDVDLLITEIAEFLTGAPSSLAPLRHIEVVLFTDLVESTQRAVDEGDAHWQALLDIHDRTAQQAVHRHGGRVVKYTGDGVLALMPSASAALDAAATIRDQLAQRGLHMRVGIHVGDVDTRGDDVSGLAVNIAARIMAIAEPDETLVSEAARHAVLGSRHRFDEPRIAHLKGIPDQWQLFRSLP
jgi:class 3 adenylate cyclase